MTSGSGASGIPSSRGRPDRLADRAEAGRWLAERLATRGLGAPVVLAIPRGGVPVAYPIARRLDAPLDILVVRKVGLPGDPEYGLGAVGEGGVVVLDEARAAVAGVTRARLEPEIRREALEVEARLARFRSACPAVDLAGADVVLVDDGVATGGTVEAAVAVLRSRGPRSVTLALGVAPAEAVERLRRVVDGVEVALVPRFFEAVGLGYRRFEPVEDSEVLGWLVRARAEREPARERSTSSRRAP